MEKNSPKIVPFNDKETSLLKNKVELLENILRVKRKNSEKTKMDQYNNKPRSTSPLSKILEEQNRMEMQKTKLDNNILENIKKIDETITNYEKSIEILRKKKEKLISHYNNNKKYKEKIKSFDFPCVVL